MNGSGTLTRQHGFGFAGGLILLGVFGLLWNLDVLPNGFWGEFWTLWPLLVVAVGVNLVLSRQRAWIGSAAALAVVTGSLAAAWVLAVADPSPSPSLTMNSESIRVPSDGAQSARLNLTWPAAIFRSRAARRRACCCPADPRRPWPKLRTSASA